MRLIAEYGRVDCNYMRAQFGILPTSVSDVWGLMPRCSHSTWSHKTPQFPIGSLCSQKSSPVLAHRCYASQASSVASQASSQDQKSRRMLMYLTAVVFAMLGGSYAAVPLYRRFCQATGYGGTVQRREVRLEYPFLYK